MRYRAWADAVRAAALLEYVPSSYGRIKASFWLPMPASWSVAKRATMAGQPHRQKPDLDNLIKALLDALYSDDSGIYSVEAYKMWAVEPRTEVSFQ
jgi:Holliday junction resolvase RusA-like endonuclease